MAWQKYFKFRKSRPSTSGATKEKRKWSERIRDVYKLTIRKEDSLEVVTSFDLTLLNLYALFSMVFLLIALLVIVLFGYTPLRNYLPGSHPADVKQIQQLNRQIAEMQRELQAQLTYQEALKRRILGEYQYADTSQSAPARFSPAQLNTPKTEAEKQLEAQVKRDAFFKNHPPDKGGALKSLKAMEFVSPVIGEASAGFNPGIQHFGIDIIAPKNTAVKAVADGIVVFSDWTMETGNTIVIKHANDLISVYKHNEKLLKKSGQTVKAGEAIAIIGNTGTLTSGPHLHFELWYRQTPLNPREYIRFE